MGRVVRRAAAYLLGAAVLACQDAVVVDGWAPSAPSADIIDEPRGGRASFFWLPPLVPPPSYTGSFDGKANIIVRIGEHLPGGGSREVAILRTGGAPGARVGVEPHLESYVATWRTTQCTWGTCRLEPNRVYTIQVSAIPVAEPNSEHFLGSAEAFLVARPGDLALVDRTKYFPVLNGGPLVLRFRLETGILSDITISPTAVTLAAGSQSQLSSVTIDIHGNVIAHPVTWLSTDNTVATVSSDGLVTAHSPGTATIIVAADWMGAQSQITVTPASGETPPTHVSPRPGSRILQDNPASGCPADPVKGSGYRAQFKWQPASGKGPIAGYHFHATHPASGTVLISIVVQQGALDFHFPSCEKIDQAMLDGWQWQVRAWYTDGSYGPFSTPEPFGFLPFETSADFSLNAPDYGSGKTQLSLSGNVDAVTSAAVRLQTRMVTGVTVFNPPAVEFYWSDGATYWEWFEPLGPWTSVTQFDLGGVRRIWNQWMSWDPASPVPVGTVAVLATGVDQTGTRLLSTRNVVYIVP